MCTDSRDIGEVFLFAETGRNQVTHSVSLCFLILYIHTWKVFMFPVLLMTNFA